MVESVIYAALYFYRVFGKHYAAIGAAYFKPVFIVAISEDMHTYGIA